MTEILNRFIEALRDELQQYGEMLALLDQQQELVVARQSDDLLLTVASINSQSGVIQRAREHRERCQTELAGLFNQPAGDSLAALVPQLPPDYRPLVEALVDENNELLVRVQQRARQNHMLLSRSVELMQRFISTLLPAGGGSKMYRGDGNMFSAAVTGRSLYEAVG